MPSDWRYREDLIYLLRDDMKTADKWKIRLEIQQRLDRKHRKDVEKKRKKGQNQQEYANVKVLFNFKKLGCNKRA